MIDVDSWCERCGRKHTMHGQVEHCMGCGGDRFVFRSPGGRGGADSAPSERACEHKRQRNEWLDTACDVLLNHCEDCDVRLSVIRLAPFIPGTYRRADA